MAYMVLLIINLLIFRMDDDAHLIVKFDLNGHFIKPIVVAILNDVHILAIVSDGYWPVKVIFKKESVFGNLFVLVVEFIQDFLDFDVQLVKVFRQLGDHFVD